MENTPGVADPLLDRGGVAASFAAAGEATCGGGVSLDRLSMAGASISLLFASQALRERLTPAFAHLALPPDEDSAQPALTIHLWDSASTGAEPPPRPRVPENHAYGALYHFHEPPLRAVRCEVLDPPELRADVVEWLQGVLQRWRRRDEKTG